jgi:hypothetical protein
MQNHRPRVLLPLLAPTKVNVDTWHILSSKIHQLQFRITKYAA